MIKRPRDHARVAAVKFMPPEERAAYQAYADAVADLDRKIIDLEWRRWHLVRQMSELEARYRRPHYTVTEDLP